MEGPSRFKHRSTDCVTIGPQAQEVTERVVGAEKEGVLSVSAAILRDAPKAGVVAEGGTNSVRSKSISCVSVRARVTPNRTCSLGARLVFWHSAV